jgi:hypothetical protein
MMRPSPPPPPPDLAAAADLASRVEKRLGRWLDLEPNPTIEQIASASQAVWRLTAVRKTLLIAANGYPVRRKSLREIDPELADILRLVLDLEQAVSARNNPEKAAQSPNPTVAMSPEPTPQPKTPDNPLQPPPPDHPSFPSSTKFTGYRTPPRRRPASVPSVPSMSSTPSSSHSSHLSSCPSLRAPFHSARAAESQVNALYKSSSLSKDRPASHLVTSDWSDRSDAFPVPHGPNTKSETRILKSESRSLKPGPLNSS